MHNSTASVVTSDVSYGFLRPKTRPPSPCFLAKSPICGCQHLSVVGAMLSSCRGVQVTPRARKLYVPHTEPWRIPSRV